MASIGERIKHFRELRGMTQEALAERCAVSASCVSRWETGNLVPKRANQEKIAKALDICFDDLYISPEVVLPSSVIIREILKILYELSPEEQKHILQYVQLFQKFELRNKL